MRSLLYVVICTIGLGYLAPALANKARSPNQIVLELKQPAVAGQPLTLITTLASQTDFEQGTARVVISPLGRDGASPIEVFSGSGKAGFDFSDELTLAALLPGKYRVHGTFIISGQQGNTPMRTGSNLYLEVRADRVLSSTVSFTQIQRRELQAQLDARKKNGLANDSASLQAQAPELYQSLQQMNQVQTITSAALPSIKAKSGNTWTNPSAAGPLIPIVTLSPAEDQAADPRKRLKPKTVGLDKQNAVLETPPSNF